MVLGVLSVTWLLLAWAAAITLLPGGSAWVPGIILCLGLLAALPAIILGRIAYNRSRKAPQQYGGRRFAIAGFVMGCASISVMMLLVAITVPYSGKARTPAMQKACIVNLRQIDAAKDRWALEHKKTQGEAMVDEEVNLYLKNSQRPVCPSGGTYTYGAVGVDPTCSLGAALGHTL
jgi:hypothetical protein